MPHFTATVIDDRRIELPQGALTLAHPGEKIEVDLPDQAPCSIATCESSEDTVGVGVDAESKVRAQYEYSAFDQVQDFLSSHDAVASILLDGLPVVWAIFGPAAVVTLSLVSDQESSPELAAVIHVSANIDEARSLRREFYRSWWMPIATLQRPHLSFNVEPA